MIAILFFAIRLSIASEKVVGGTAPAPESEQLEHFSTLRDPFVAPKLAGGNRVERKGLELYSVGEFKVTGMVSGPKRKKAMIIAPDGKAYFVSENMKIGNHDGIIKRITSEKVVVKEKILNLLGQDEVVETEILFPQISDSGYSAGGSPSGNKP